MTHNHKWQRRLFGGYQGDWSKAPDGTKRTCVACHVTQVRRNGRWVAA